MRSPTLLLLCSLVLFAALFLVSTSRAAEVRFPYASADGPARYAGWVPTYAAAAAAAAGRHAPLHRVTLYLAPRNLDRLDDMFWAVSDPESPQYAKYLTTDEITEIVSAPREAVKSVVEWLHQQGAAAVEVARNRDAIVAMMPVDKVETAFAVSLRRFMSPDGSRTILRSSKPYALPSTIAAHIDLISGLTDFPPVGSGKKLALEASSSSVVSSAALAPSTPVVTMARARGGAQVTVSFIPVCANGQYTKNAGRPCSEAPPAIAGFYLQLNSTSAAVGKSKSQWADISCSFNGNFTTCTATISAWLFDALNVSVAAAFENDSVGPYGFNPYPVLATPPIVPQSIWKQYNIPPNTLVTNANVTQCVVEFEQQYYSPDDLTLFLEQTGLPTDTPVTVVGPNYPNQPGGEANLDIQYIMGVAPGAPTVFWSIYANSTAEIDDILQWALQMSNTDNPPQVNSLSYGMSEVNVDKYLGRGYLARADFEFKKLALRGITIIIASGDTGAGDLGDEPMTVPNCDTLHADWPSQSVYVTSVGSTIITPAAEPICYREAGAIDCLGNPLGEIVVSVDQGLFWTSGGGFSNISKRAPYQEQEVARYLNHKSITFPAPGVWNPSGRAYPDVAAVGHNLMVALSGKFIPVDGTSASAPIFAGVITLLNDARAAAGLPPLGFLNPILYKARRERPQTFYDVTWGNNRCGALGFDPVCCPNGYHATDGWDAATGLGTPNFLELKQFVLQYPKTAN